MCMYQCVFIYACIYATHEISMCINVCVCINVCISTHAYMLPTRQVCVQECRTSTPRGSHSYIHTCTHTYRQQQDQDSPRRRTSTPRGSHSYIHTYMHTYIQTTTRSRLSKKAHFHTLWACYALHTMQYLSKRQGAYETYLYIVSICLHVHVCSCACMYMYTHDA
jgi:hypothetical protein